MKIVYSGRKKESV